MIALIVCLAVLFALAAAITCLVRALDAATREEKHYREGGD